MREKLYQTMIELTNGKWSSSLIRGFTQSKASKRIIPSYIKFFNISTTEIQYKRERISPLYMTFLFVKLKRKVVQLI